MLLRSLESHCSVTNRHAQNFQLELLDNIVLNSWLLLTQRDVIERWYTGTWAGLLLVVERTNMPYLLMGKSMCSHATLNVFLLSRIVRFSVLPALSLLDGVLHLKVVKGSINTEHFNSFIDALLDNMNPFPAKNSVIIMDNAKIHKSPDLRPMIEAR